jgi:hypothetical protein
MYTPRRLFYVSGSVCQVKNFRVAQFVLYLRPSSGAGMSAA